jgi:2-methylcitrate dehydratase PrpD
MLIAEDGFTGAPAATIEFDDTAFAWADLGERWLTCEQYVKPYPICRWAHAPIDAVRMLKRQYGFSHHDVERLEIATFGNSAELNQSVPTDTTIAQYSINWPVAAMLVRDRVGVEEVLPSSFDDPEIIAMTARCEVRIDPEIEAGFPARRQASVQIRLKDGRVLESGLTTASGGPDPQPDEAEVVAKFREFAASALPESRVREIEASVMALDQRDADFTALLKIMIASGEGV